MILLFPSLVEGINTPAARAAFKPACHMFYTQRVCDVKDGLDKWTGIDYSSDLIDDEGQLVERFEEGMKEGLQEKKRKRQEGSQREAVGERKRWEREQGPEGEKGGG